MSQRLKSILMAALGGTFLLFLVIGMAEWAAVADSPEITRIDRADFVPSNARRPPDDTAAWKTVSLPDEWRSRPDIKGPGWYRIKLTLDPVPTGLQSILLRYRRAQQVTFFVNGKRIGGSREAQAEAAGRAGTGAESTLGLTVPPYLLRAGENVIHVRMEASSHPAKVHGLGRVYFGEARPLRRMHIWLNELGVNSKREATVMALAAGIIALFLWLAHRSDRVMFWFSMTCMFWGALGVAYTRMRWEGAFQVSSVLHFSVAYGLVVPTLILSLRTVELKWPKFEIALWLFFLFELSYPLWPTTPWPGALLAWDVINVGLLLGAVGIVLHAAHRPLAWPMKLQVAALMTMAAFMGYEIARFFGWVPIETPVMRHYHVPVMLLAMGAACFERHARAIRRAEHMNVELQQRVAEKTREIEASHSQIESALLERALANEHQRILADMHDGLGATLVSLLRYVQTGSADPATVRGRVQDALREMRAAISTLQSHGGDLAVVLGSLRERLDGLMAGSGVRLIWQVEDLAEIVGLKPLASFSLQCIVLEAVGNALKHSNATEVRFILRACGDGNVEIRIEDNGRGFDPAHAHAGLGLGNMRARAGRVGGKLDIDSQAGEGAVVRLTIPCLAAAGPGESANPKVSSATAGLAPTARIATIITAVVAVLLMTIHAPLTEAAVPPSFIEFEQAEFFESEAPFPPNEAAPWRPVALPDEWQRHTGATKIGWYRMKFVLGRAPSGLQSIMVRHLRAYDIAIFVNGKLVGTARDNQSLTGSQIGGGLGIAIRHNVLADMLRAGENVIHVRMEASSHPALFHGLGRVYFGDARPVRQIYNRSNELGFAAKRNFIFMALAAGLIALFMWLARRSDRVMFWFSMTCLTWGTAGVAYLMWRWSDWTQISNLLYFYTIYGLVVPTLILSLRTVDLKWPRIETSLWLFFAVELTYPLWAHNAPSVHILWNVTNSGLLLGAVGVVLYSAPRPMRWPLKLQAVALATMAAVMSYEIARYFGWVDVESPEIRHFHVPLMLVAMGALCFDRYARAIRLAERATVELEQSVAEKTREIEMNYARVEEAVRESVLAQERRHILADMHDGLGKSLVSVLRNIDGGRVERANIERRVQGALQEMRIAIDALQPHGGDLSAVLGGLRDRIDGLLAGSDVRLIWLVDELPQVGALYPATVFSLQRIVLESIDNVLMHAGASEIRFAARAREDGDIEIRVEDDGRGFELQHAPAGTDLDNMRARAKRIGARFSVDTRPGAGTIVRLIISRAAPTLVTATQAV